MTDRKDFKRVVRARARKTGESYSSALRNVRNARQDRSAASAPTGETPKEPTVTIIRAIPDVRTTNVDKTVRFYTGLLGFDTHEEDGRVVAFVSSSHDGVEVRLHGDDFALPPGFTVELATAADVRALFDRAPAAGVRIIDPLGDERPEFSVLDPSGRRVTVRAADRGRRPSASPSSDRPIARAIPGSVLEAEAAKRFYVDFVGFRVRRAWPDVLMFESPSGSGAQVLTGSSLTSPDAFDLDVGTPRRVDNIHAAAVGNAVVMGEPQDFPAQGVRCFLLIDPNGVAINVAARLDS